MYASDLPQRNQDLEQAKSLLKQAGQEGLTVELVTAPVFSGVVEAAQVFAEQAKGAGVNVKVRKVDSGTFYGDNYLSGRSRRTSGRPRAYLAQVAQGDLPNSPFNETHWKDAEFVRCINQARGTTDEAKRKDDPAPGAADRSTTRAATSSPPTTSCSTSPPRACTASSRPAPASCWATPTGRTPG